MTTRLVVLVVTVVASVASLAADGERRAPLLRATADGAVQLESSRDGQAVLDASGLRPGGSVEGSLTLRNRAPAPQRLTLTADDVKDVAGPGGGALSEWLDLRVERDGDVVYTGKLGDLRELDAGELPAGASAPFRFLVTLPELGPPVDDLYAGAAVEVGWSWRGDADLPAELAPPELPRGEGAPSAADDAPSGGRLPSVDESEGAPASRSPTVRLWLGARTRQRLGRTLSLSATCRPGCTVRARAKAKIRGRWRSLGLRSLGAIASRATQPEALSFRLSPRAKRLLRAALRRRGSVRVRIVLSAAAPGHRPVKKRRTLRLRP